MSIAAQEGATASTAVHQRGDPSGDPVRILIADESPTIISNLTRRLALEADFTVCAAVGDGEAAVAGALRVHPDIAVVDAALPGIDGGQATEMLTQYLPAMGVIMMSMEADNDAYRMAMAAGAREFLQKPFTGDDLVAAVRRLRAREVRRTVTSVARPAPSFAEPEDTAAAPGTRGSVTTVIAGKGGVGKTVLAVNLAVALAADSARRTVLVDASLQFGDVAAVLNLKADHTVVDLVAGGDTIDPALLLETLVAGPQGTFVLVAPSSPELAEQVTPDHLRAIVELLVATFDHVVIDTAGGSLSDTTLTAADLSDHVVLLTDLSMLGVKNARLARGVLESLEIDAARVIPVGNHCAQSGELERSDAEAFLGVRLGMEIVHEPRVIPNSIAVGIPFVTTDPTARASESVRALARLVDPWSQSSGDLASGEENSGKRRARRRLGHRA